jgi:hypothetical protein
MTFIFSISRLQTLILEFVSDNSEKLAVSYCQVDQYLLKTPRKKGDLKLKGQNIKHTSNR